jgi:acetyltransferase-like isoleucine patch superfamily enzyme
MIKQLVQKILQKKGKQYQIDSQIPDKLLVEMLMDRTMMRFRGLLFLQKKVFLGSDCIIKNKKNITLGKNCTIEKGTRIDGYAANKIELGDCCKIGAYSLITCTSHLSKYGIGLKMGNHSAIGDFAHFGASGGIQIGNDVIMGSYISFHSENHNFNDTTKLIREQGVTSKGIKLGNNIWVGSKVTFLDGSTVGDNCVIAAGAVVNGTFPENVVIGGIPAKNLKTIE